MKKSKKTTTTTVAIVFFCFSSLIYGQWSSEAEQANLRSIWPAGVPWPESLKFYKVAQAIQRPVIRDPGDRDMREFMPLSGDPQQFRLWNSPGGLTWSDRREWRNATGLAIPVGGQIEWWLEWTEVPGVGFQRPGGRLPVLRWAFPDGTVTVDMLIRRGAVEKCFEVRVREKRDGQWDSGTAYRPFSKPPAFTSARSMMRQATAGTNPEIAASLTTLGLGKIDYRYWETEDKFDSLPASHRFVPTKAVVVDEGGLMPRGYSGPGLSCAKCHDNAGQVLGYAATETGGDTVRSWHPVTEQSIGRIGSDPDIDTRWPIRRWRRPGTPK